MVGEGIVTLGVRVVTDFRNSKSPAWIGLTWRTLPVTCITGGAKSTVPAPLRKLTAMPPFTSHAGELLQEVDVEVGAAELAVGDALQPDLLLEAHDLADRAVFRRAQLGARDRPF